MWRISSLSANMHRPVQASISSSAETCNSVVGLSCACKRRRFVSSCRRSLSFSTNSRAKNPSRVAFFFARSFPGLDVGPVESFALFLFAASLAGVTLLRIFIDRPQALSTATAVAGEPKLDLSNYEDQFKRERSLYTHKRPG